MNTKRLFVLILSLALLVGSVFAVSVSAAEDESLEIVAMNIAHGDQTYVVMAVGASVADAEAGNVAVNYTYGGETYAATYWADFGGYTEDGVTYPVYYTKGISPKDLGEDILVEAHVKGADIASPDYTDVSVAKYLFRMLYREGFVESEDAHEKNLAALYGAHLLYASNAQQALWNDKAENADNQRVLLSDMNYVYVANGGSIDGSAEAILNADGSVTVTPDGTVAGVVGWNVASYDLVGNKTETLVLGNSVAITANSILTPYVDLAYITFEDYAVGTVIEKGPSIYAAEGDGYVTLNTTGPITVVDSGDGNKAITQPKGTYYWFFAGNRDLETKNVSVIELDIDFREITFQANNGLGAAEQLQFRTETNNGSNVFSVEVRYYDADYGYTVKVIDNIAGTSSAQIKTGLGLDSEDILQKLTLKIEYMWETGAIRVSVNGNVLYNEIITASSPVKRNYYVNGNASVYLDNIKSINEYVDPTGFATAE